MKKIISICLIGALAGTLLAGCGSTSDSESSQDSEESVTETEVEENVEDVEESVEEDVEEAVSGFNGFEDTITITGYGMTLFSDDGLDEVLEAINEISIPAINVEFDYTEMDMSSYSEQIGLMFSGGEKFDLLMVAPINSALFSVMLSKNELMDITDYLDEYASDMMEFMDTYIDPYTKDGKVYGIPDYKLYNTNYYLIMRKDILDYLDLTEQAEAISSWSAFEDLMEIIYDAQDSLPEDLQTPALINNTGEFGSIMPLLQADVAGDDFSEFKGYDSLGDTWGVIFTSDDGTVSNFFDREDYLTVINRTREWYQKGWVYKDAATSLDNGDSAIANGVSFCVMEGSEIGVESAKKAATGYDVLCVKICDVPIQTVNVNAWGWAVPVTASEPEAAIAFLNLMYTNADIVNLLTYGIEGRDYDLNEEGEAVVREDAVYQSSDWMYGNQFLSYPQEGQGGDFRETSLALMDDAPISQYYGITIDTSDIEAELSSVYAVVQKYAPGLQSGTIDASETYDDFLSELDSAGMQTVVDFYQSELDEWLATQ